MIKKTKAAAHTPDWILIGAIGAILLIGLFMLTSAGAVTGLQKFNDSYHFLKQQLWHGLLPGLILLLIFSRINYQFWKKLALPFLILSVLLLITVFIPGLGANFGTARSWVQIGNISFQPSELVKLTFLLYLCCWLSRRGEHGVKDLYYGFLPFVFLLGIIAALILLQPDLGTLAVIIFMCVAVFFASGAKWKHIFILIIGGFGAIYGLVAGSSYRASRLMTFLHPELDPQGVGYHINQAFLAIGSGGFWGLGFGQSRQKFQYLPEATGDSIFAIMAEEMGFIFGLVLIGLWLLFIYRGLTIARRATDSFGRLLTIGIISWLAFQAFFNISSMIGLVPMTGIPLPFVSAGGTALAISLAAVGILINISRQTKQA